MSWKASEGAGVTALGLAAARSVETGRADRLIEDPLARTLYEAAGTDLGMRLTWPEPGEEVSDREALHLHGSRYIGMRTRHYDDRLRAAVDAGIGQAVLLGAGLDTRAFRLGLPAAFQLYEIDQDDVLTYKRVALEGSRAGPTCARTLVSADLRGDWCGPLADAGFDPARPAVWIGEGLLPYLSPEGQLALVAAIGELAATSSRLDVDRIVGDPTRAGRARELSERAGIDMESLFARGDQADLTGRLRATGWEVNEQSAADLGARYGRDLADPFSRGTGGGSEPPWLETSFITARLSG